MFLSYKAALREPMMTQEEEASAFLSWHQKRDHRALERIVRSHARIAWSIAGRYTRNDANVEDLAQEGMLGIMRAADKYDPSRGIRFATYCRWWIRTFIATAAAQVETVVDMPARTFSDARMGRLPEGDQQKALAAASGGLSLDAPLGDGDLSAKDLLPCPEPDPEEGVGRIGAQELWTDSLRRAMRGLKPREIDVLIRRRLSENPETLEQVAVDLGVTRERIRQIEVAALGKLRKALLHDGFPVHSLS